MIKKRFLTIIRCRIMGKGAYPKRQGMSLDKRPYRIYGTIFQTGDGASRNQKGMLYLVRNLAPVSGRVILQEN